MAGDLFDEIVGDGESSLLITPRQLGDISPGLHGAGFIEGQNVALEIRSTDDCDQLPVRAEEMVRRRVAVLAVQGTLRDDHYVRRSCFATPIQSLAVMAPRLASSRSLNSVADNFLCPASWTAYGAINVARVVIGYDWLLPL
jgi:hypothetical protein